GSLLTGCGAEPKLEDLVSPADQQASASGSASAPEGPSPAVAPSLAPELGTSDVGEDALTTSDTRVAASETVGAAEGRRCPQRLGNTPTELDTRFSVALTVHTPRSQLSETTLCGVLEELNQIWW